MLVCCYRFCRPHVLEWNSVKVSYNEFNIFNEGKIGNSFFMKRFYSLIFFPCGSGSSIWPLSEPDQNITEAKIPTPQNWLRRRCAGSAHFWPITLQYWWLLTSIDSHSPRRNLDRRPSTCQSKKWQHKLDWQSVRRSQLVLQKNETWSNIFFVFII